MRACDGQPSLLTRGTGQGVRTGGRLALGAGDGENLRVVGHNPQHNRKDRECTFVGDRGTNTFHLLRSAGSVEQVQRKEKGLAPPRRIVAMGCIKRARQPASEIVFDDCMT